MSISFQDIRLKAQQKLDYNAQVEICANVVSDYCQKVYKSFESETKLDVNKHFAELLNTTHFLEYFTFLNEHSATFVYPIRKKSLFKDAINLKGTVYFKNTTTALLHFHIDGPCEDALIHIKQFTTIISAKLAQL